MQKRLSSRKLSPMQLECLQFVCASTSFEELTTQYAERIELLSEVSIVKCTNDANSVNLYEPFASIPDIKQQLYTPFMNGSVNFINSNILVRLRLSGNGLTLNQRCISFDTQTVSYLNRYYQGKTDTLPPNLLSVIKLMQMSNIGVDYIPYTMENLLLSKNDNGAVFDSILSFEKLFYGERKSDRYCRRNVCKILKSYEKLRSSDCFEGKQLYYKVYVTLLEVVRIQLACASATVEERMQLLCNFMDIRLGLIMHPELILAKRYFENGQKYSFFGKVQKHRSDILTSIKNMSWDLLHLRMLELGCMALGSRQADLFIPYMFTYDKRLLEVKECYELDAFAVCIKSCERFPF